MYKHVVPSPAPRRWHIGDWEASSEDRWTLPIGGGFGRVLELGGQPVNFSLQGYWIPDTPEPTGADWAIVFDFELLYTKRGFRSWLQPKSTPN